MQKLKYILMLIGAILGVIFPILGAMEPCLNEDLEASSYLYIPDMRIFIAQITIGISIGIISAWGIWTCINWLKRKKH